MGRCAPPTPRDLPGVGLAELDQALEAVDTIIRLRDEGRASFDASEERRWALAFL